MLGRPAEPPHGLSSHGYAGRARGSADHSHAISRAGCGRSYLNRPSGRSSGRSSSPSSNRSSGLPNDPPATRRAASSRPPHPRTPCPHSLDHGATSTLTACDALNVGLAWRLQEGFTSDTNSNPTCRVHACVFKILLTLATLPSGGRDQGRMSSLLPEYIVFGRAHDIRGRRGRPQRGRPPRGRPPRMVSSNLCMLLVGPRATGMGWTAFKTWAFGAQGASWE